MRPRLVLIPVLVTTMLACGKGPEPAAPTAGAARAEPAPATAEPAAPAVEPAPATEPTAPAAATAPVASAAPANDACERIQHLSTLADAPSARDVADTITTCRDEAWPASVPECLGRVASMAAIEPCLRPVQAPQHARRLLLALEAAAAIHAAGGTGFPVGTAGPLPARPCCALPRQTCDSRSSDWRGVWATLGFSASGPSAFQLSYESKGKDAMVARATGDLDCDGTPIVYELRGRMNGDQPAFELVEPELAAD